ncbi:hypothetical protein [Lacibacter sp.]|uniref:hypothetical protein n=1 Tax=Lacibacter sp. TaxID=1915409 RepID=UPI002B4AE009|nr:hypothetical protein [Lacibacter sp.]HLP37965.1 hypothetical protein [Lacibacter sp.]
MKFLCIFLFNFFVFVNAYSQEKPLLPEQERLAVFIGRWTVEGSEATYLEVCNRIQGNHIQCVSASKEKNGIDSSVSYLSFSPLEKTYVYYGLYPSGNSRTLRGKWVTDRFIFEGQRILPEKTTKWRVTIKPVEKDLHFVEEASVDNVAWEKKADFMYKRIQ